MRTVSISGSSAGWDAVIAPDGAERYPIGTTR